MSSGRGPIRLISPLITFQNCGSSSSFKRLKTGPIRVSRCSSVSSDPSASEWDLIDLSLYSRRGFPRKPVRSCIETGDSLYTAVSRKASIKMMGLKNVSTRMDATISANLLKRGYKNGELLLVDDQPVILEKHKNRSTPYSANAPIGAQVHIRFRSPWASSTLRTEGQNLFSLMPLIGNAAFALLY
jgi:hypothetical protein